MKVTQTGSNPSTDVSSAQGARGAKGADKAQAKKDKSESGSSSSVATGDAVKTEISSRARELASAKKTAGAAPDVREEKIAELKRRIAEGKYNVDASDVADRMVDEHLQMSGIG